MRGIGRGARMTPARPEDGEAAFLQGKEFGWIQHRVCVLMSRIVSSYNFDINQRSTAFSPRTGSKYVGLVGSFGSLLGLLNSAVFKGEPPEALCKRAGIFTYRNRHGSAVREQK